MINAEIKAQGGGTMKKEVNSERERERKDVQRKPYSKPGLVELGTITAQTTQTGSIPAEG